MKYIYKQYDQLRTLSIIFMFEMKMFAVHYGILEGNEIAQRLFFRSSWELSFQCWVSG